MATQTLAGTDISNEILNNISDHYILKCAMTDSERLVERSSEFTSKLQTGQVFYHNVDAQIIFQTYFIDSDSAKSQVDLINKKAASHYSNEKFYFNGLQLFGLHELVSNTVDNKSKYPIAYLGKNISIQQDDISIQLKKDCSENILVFGQNDQEQVTRSTMNMFLSLLMPVLIHGFYDYCLFTGEVVLVLAFFIFVILIYILAFRRVFKLSKIQVPLKPIYCTKCGMSSTGNFCPNCGSKM